MASMTCFSLEGFRTAGALSVPSAHLAMVGFLRPDHHAANDGDYTGIGRARSFNPPSLEMGPVMDETLEELRAEAAADAETFGIDLRGRPTTMTLSGQARAKDGRLS